MNVLIIGLGSIAKKHIGALKKIKPEVHFFALRSSNLADQFEDVVNVLSIAECPQIDFVIISNPTAFHAEAIKQVVHLKKPLFIEKPPFHTLEAADECLILVNKNNILTYTAFNLRFRDCLIHLKKNVVISKVQEVNVYCGSYLPSWRNNSDYKKNYSAHAAMGGGVHLDLIHELDYVLWIFGAPREVRSLLRNCSKIDIKAVDYANYILIYDTFVVNIVLNYYRRDTKRSCEIVFDDFTWEVNLINNKIINTTDNSVVFQSEQTVLDTYTAQLDYFCNIIANNENPFNSLTESINTLKIALL